MLLKFALRFIVVVVGAAALGALSELAANRQFFELAIAALMAFALLPAGSWAAAAITNETELGLHRKRANPKGMLAVMVMLALVAAFAAGKFLIWKP